MALAVCIDCGEIKEGVRNACPSCGIVCKGEAVAYRLTDAHLEHSELKQVGQAISVINGLQLDGRLRYHLLNYYVSESWPQLGGLIPFGGQDLLEQIDELYCKHLINRPESQRNERPVGGVGGASDSDGSATSARNRAESVDSSTVTSLPTMEISVSCPKCRAPYSGYLHSTDTQHNCPSCNTTILTLREVRGIVYILSNPSMPGLLKIGITTRPLRERLSELSSPTGVPEPFHLEAFAYSDDPESDEARIHASLAEFRVPNREFFRVTIHRAAQVCSSICGREMAVHPST